MDESTNQDKYALEVKRAIFNWYYGGGVNGAIHRAAGSKLLDKCRKFNGCNTGESNISGSYNINHVDRI